jgi:hypothetical protein
MRFRIVVASVILFGTLVQAQTKVGAQPKPQSPPQKDDLTSAREATDNFLNGLKLAELPEGRQLLLETQWITGDADYGENFYHRPRFTEVTSLFEKLFDTDVPGVQGYKRLLDMKAVSKAGTPLLTRYFMVAFKDRRTNEWKVLDTGTEEDADVDRQIVYFGQRLHKTDFTPERDNYLNYGHWLLLAGRTKEARQALTTALSASPKATDPAWPYSEVNETLHRLQVLTLLDVIDAITGNMEGIKSGETLPAEAAQLVQVGRLNTTEEDAQLIRNGQASIAAVITSPAGAQVYVDGQKGGVTPFGFVLLKRDAPRTVTIKLAGYKTVEKTFVPDGTPIPIAITLEKETK